MYTNTCDINKDLGPSTVYRRIQSESLKAEKERILGRLQGIISAVLANPDPKDSTSKPIKGTSTYTPPTPASGIDSDSIIDGGSPHVDLQDYYVLNQLQILPTKIFGEIKRLFFESIKFLTEDSVLPHDNWKVDIKMLKEGWGRIQKTFANKIQTDVSSLFTSAIEFVDLDYQRAYTTKNLIFKKRVVFFSSLVIAAIGYAVSSTPWMTVGGGVAAITAIFIWTHYGEISYEMVFEVGEKLTKRILKLMKPNPEPPFSNLNPSNLNSYTVKPPGSVKGFTSNFNTQ